MSSRPDRALYVPGPRRAASASTTAAAGRTSSVHQDVSSLQKGFIELEEAKTVLKQLKNVLAHDSPGQALAKARFEALAALNDGLDELKEHDEEQKHWLDEYYKAVSPIMLEELLRYIAVDLAPPKSLLNTGRPQNYPTKEELVNLRKDGKLDSHLANLLIQATSDENIGELLRLRHDAAHPNGQNGGFLRMAHILEQHTPGWEAAAHAFVLSKKGLAAAAVAQRSQKAH
ncbi:hypothetical protein JCM10213v2_007740 [Rhodosporidiobolus nylandii]